MNSIIRELGTLSAAAPRFPLALSAVVALLNKAEAQDMNDFSYSRCDQNSTACEEIPAALLTGELKSLADGIWRQK